MRNRVPERAHGQSVCALQCVSLNANTTFQAAAMQSLAELYSTCGLTADG